MSLLRNLTDWLFPTLEPLPYDYYTSLRKLYRDTLDREELSVSNKADAHQWAEDKANQLQDEKERNTRVIRNAPASFHAAN